MDPKLYYFPPWRKQFIFSSTFIHNKLVRKKFYYAYNHFTALIWKLWLYFPFFRKLFVYNPDDFPSYFSEVKDKFNLVEANCLINLGTPGPDQKITIIITKNLGQSFFIKAGNTNRAKELILNEARVLMDLSENKLFPTFIDFEECEHLSYLTTSVLDGKKLSNILLNQQIISLSIYINSLKEVHHNADGLIYTFSHGDFCPWNLMDDNNNFKVFDWELAGYYPLGFDLFTFAFQTNFLLYPKKSFSSIMSENLTSFEEYFTVYYIGNFKPYLINFLTIKLNTTINKSSKLYSKYLQLYHEYQ
ncbi:phosphotransferase [Telluribacter sp.]|jgi:hypothetical protein|uniref:phosphotransferase n=1 Tax=Telluribacter sp. TaxID=1978767 RepID=UPI002E0D2DB3|nr:phosphotransferase [Telluribacter sp.]